MANRSANHFTLAGGGVKGTVDTTSFTGKPAIDITVDGTQIIDPSLADTENGFEVTAVVEQVPDSHTVRLTLLVPHVNLTTEAKRFTGAAVLTTARTTIGGESLVDGVVHHYDLRTVNGTAEAIDS
jgi:hypothetical protein